MARFETVHLYLLQQLNGYDHLESLEHRLLTYIPVAT